MTIATNNWTIMKFPSTITTMKYRLAKLFVALIASYINSFQFSPVNKINTDRNALGNVSKLYLIDLPFESGWSAELNLSLPAKNCIPIRLNIYINKQSQKTNGDMAFIVFVRQSINVLKLPTLNILKILKSLNALNAE